MSEDELQVMADDAYDLTEIARDALRAQISGRGLHIQLKDRPSPRSTRHQAPVDDLDAADSIVKVVPGYMTSSFVISPTMESIDPSQEWQRFKETYSLMSEDELQVVADDAYDLTDVAREALKAEISGRGLAIRLRDRPAPRRTKAQVPADLDADSIVKVVRRVSGLPEARRVQFILDASNIPSCLGPDNLENADAFEPGFEGEVEVKVCDIHLQRARKVLDKYLPPGPEEPQDADWVAQCPKCHSTEIFLQGPDEEPANDADSSSKSGWSCDACGHQWNDDDIKVET